MTNETEYKNDFETMNVLSNDSEQAVICYDADAESGSLSRRLISLLMVWMKKSKNIELTNFAICTDDYLALKEQMTTNNFNVTLDNRLSDDQSFINKILAYNNQTMPENKKKIIIGYNVSTKDCILGSY